MSVIQAQIDAMRQAIDAFIARDPVLAENASLMRSCKGVGAKTAQAVLAWLPEIGTLKRRKIAALVGVAPIPCKSGSSIHHAYTTAWNNGVDSFDEEQSRRETAMVAKRPQPVGGWRQHGPGDWWRRDLILITAIDLRDGCGAVNRTKRFASPA